MRVGQGTVPCPAVLSLSAKNGTRNRPLPHGGPLSDLRIDRYGNVYAVRKGNSYGEFVGTYEELLLQYGG